MSLLSQVEYGSVAVYSPRGTSDEARRSRQLIHRIKDGDIDLLEKLVQRIVVPHAQEKLAAFLGPDRILVPAPRSHPLVEGGFWPALEICRVLCANGLGSGVAEILRRTLRVRKSAGAGLGERPVAKRHLETMVLEPELLPGADITIVDDVVTKGNTLLAAASLVHPQYPDQAVRVFALSRTLGFRPDIKRAIEPFVGEIRRSGNSASRMDS